MRDVIGDYLGAIEVEFGDVIRRFPYTPYSIYLRGTVTP